MLVFSVYLLFELNVVNYRPVLMDGILEASYLSSTTMLILCVMPTAVMQFQRLILNKRVRTVVNTFCGIYAGFMVAGRILSGVHWFTDILGGMLLSAALVILYYAVIQLADSKASQSGRDKKEAEHPREVQAELT